MRGRLILVGLACFSCTKSNPEYCEESTECVDPVASYCDPMRNTCTAPPDAAAGVPDASPVDGPPVPDAEPSSYSLVINVLGDAPGSVTLSSPPGGNCDTTGCVFAVTAGEPVTLTANDGTAASFVGWSAACGSSLDYGCTLALDADTVVDATFDPAGSPIRQWAMKGTNAESWARVLDVVVAGDGNVIVFGDFVGAVDFGGITLWTDPSYRYQAFVARYTELGAIDWVRGIPETTNAIEVEGGIALTDEGDVVVVGGLRNDGPMGTVFVRRMERNTGATQWEWIGNAPFTTDATAMTVTSDGAVVLAGFGVSGEGLPGDYTNPFLAWLSGEDGSVVRHQALTTGDTSRIYDIAAAGTDVVITGNKGPAILLGRYASTGEAVFAPKIFGEGVGRGIALDQEGTIYVVGSYDAAMEFGGASSPLPAPVGASDAFATTFSGDGVASWAVGFGSEGIDAAHAVASDAFGRTLITGFVAGDTDFGGGVQTAAGGVDAFVTSVTAASGAYRWARILGDTTGDRGYGISVDATGILFGGFALSGDVDLGAGTVSCTEPSCGVIGVYGP